MTDPARDSQIGGSLDTNPAHFLSVRLVCDECQCEWPEAAFEELAARELGDGSIFLSCPECGRGLAVLER